MPSSCTQVLGQQTFTVTNKNSSSKTGKSTGNEAKMNGTTFENGKLSTVDSSTNPGQDLRNYCSLSRGVETSSSTVPLVGDDNLSEDVFTSIILTVVILLTLSMVHVTSEGMSPSISMIVYTAVCLVGIYRSTPNHNFSK